MTEKKASAASKKLASEIKPKPVRKFPAAKPRKRRSGIDAQALVRARAQEEAQENQSAGEGRVEALQFEEAFPLLPQDAEGDPNAPRTGPAKLPDLALIERAEAQAREKKEKKKKRASGGG